MTKGADHKWHISLHSNVTAIPNLNKNRHLASDKIKILVSIASVACIPAGEEEASLKWCVAQLTQPPYNPLENPTLVFILVRFECKPFPPWWNLFFSQVNTDLVRKPRKWEAQFHPVALPTLWQGQLGDHCQ